MSKIAIDAAVEFLLSKGVSMHSILGVHVFSGKSREAHFNEFLALNRLTIVPWVVQLKSHVLRVSQKADEIFKAEVEKSP